MITYGTNYSNNKNIEKIIEEVASRLNVMPGLLSILDVYSMRTYGKRFTVLFAEEPRNAYKILEKVLRDRESVSFVLKYLLQAFTHNDELIAKVIDELSKGNDEPLKKVMYG